LKILDEVRTRYEFLLVGYVVMPEGVIRSGFASTNPETRIS